MTDGTQGHAQRHRHRHGRRRRRGRRGLHRRRHARGTRPPGTTSWTYRWTAHGTPSTTIKVRAVDDSGNLADARRRRRPSAVNCPCSIWGANVTPAAGRRRRPDVGRGRREVHSPTSTARSAASASTRRRRTPARTSAACGPPTARASRRRRSPARPPPAGRPSRSEARRGPAEHDLRRVLLRAQRPLLGDHRLLLARRPRPARTAARSADSPPLHALRTGGTSSTTTNGVFAYGGVEHVPDELLQRRQLLGRRRCSRRPRRPGTVTNVSAAAGGRTSADVTLDRARRPAARPRPTRSRRTSARPPRRRPTINGTPRRRARP